MKKIAIKFLNRKPSAFSIEKVFNIIQNNLQNQVEIDNIYAISAFDKPINVLKNLLYFYYKLVKTKKADIYHVTGSIHYLFFILFSKKSILTVHDCIKYHQHKGFNKWIVKQLWFKFPAHFFEYITVISHETKRELVQITNCNPNKIRVIYNPLDSHIFSYPKVFNLTKPTILHIGTDLNKNIYRLISALNNIPCYLIIVGKISNDCIMHLKKNNIDYKNLYYLSEEEVREQYRQCDIVSFVTLYEGFGLPIIEAQATGRVVISSNIEPHIEIGGINGAIYVNPLSIIEIQSGILKLIQDESLRHRLIENGKQNALRFEAKSIAKQYFDYYIDIINGKN